ncbi:MAG: hypothetical protein HS108_04505 [Planctomycetes bacterium]|jgi:hypothetical protein|nr:hypothetical protein [Planctomycetota bacterium]MCL4731824.1 hypothetical protein [Planctomycetota bacterium]
MKKIATALLLALWLGVPVLAQEKKTEEKPATEQPKEEPKAAESKADPLKAYRTKGNTWTTKTTIKSSAFEMVTYSRMEVTEVTEEKAVVKNTTLDKDQKEMSSTTFEIKLKAEPAAEQPKAAGDAPKIEEETIKVEAGEFKCTKVVVESEGFGGKTKTTTWTCKSCFLTVKNEVSSNMGSTVTELVKLELK